METFWILVQDSTCVKRGEEKSFTRRSQLGVGKTGVCFFAQIKVEEEADYCKIEENKTK